MILWMEPLSRRPWWSRLAGNLAVQSAVVVLAILGAIALRWPEGEDILTRPDPAVNTGIYQPSPLRCEAVEGGVVVARLDIQCDDDAVDWSCCQRLFLADDQQTRIGLKCGGVRCWGVKWWTADELALAPKEER